MSGVQAEIDAELRAFVESQRVFFVGTAPSGAQGHVNVSPKGVDGLRVLGPRTVVWRDRVGSGIETLAHLRENGRITLLFCAFEGRPRIVRLQGRGSVVLAGAAEFAELSARFEPAQGVRSLVRVELDRIASSCGYGVPLFDYRGQRPTLDDWAASKGPQGVAEFQAQHNAHSIDGLPGHVPAPDPTAGRNP